MLWECSLGHLTPPVQMNQDTEKWPDFNITPDHTSMGGVDGAKPRVSVKAAVPYLMEETDSGMFTLRKKKDQQRSAMNGSETLATPVM